MEGTFRMGDEKFQMSIMEDNSLSRMRRAAGTDMWTRAKMLTRGANAKSKVYGIYKVEGTPFTPTDFKIDRESL